MNNFKGAGKPLTQITTITLRLRSSQCTSSPFITINLVTAGWVPYHSVPSNISQIPVSPHFIILLAFYLLPPVISIGCDGFRNLWLSHPYFHILHRHVSTAIVRSPFLSVATLVLCTTSALSFFLFILSLTPAIQSTVLGNCCRPAAHIPKLVPTGCRSRLPGSLRIILPKIT